MREPMMEVRKEISNTLWSGYWLRVVGLSRADGITAIGTEPIVGNIQFKRPVKAPETARVLERSVTVLSALCTAAIETTHTGISRPSKSIATNQSANRGLSGLISGGGFVNWMPGLS